MPTLLQMSGITKHFGPVAALSGVDLRVQAGEVHALIGENGAGKSTLMKILSGAYQPDAGSIHIDDRPVTITGPADGRRHGIAMIYQELTLAPQLTIEENITLGLEQHRLGLLRSQRPAVMAALERLGYGHLNPRARVSSLGIGAQQIVELARALLIDARLIILDEPTSSLGARDTDALFGVIRRLRESGVAVIYISHFLEEVQRVCDRYTVLRDGASVGSGDVAGTPIARFVQQMVGRDVSEMFPRTPHVLGAVALTVDGLSRREVPDTAVSWELRRGEIMGIAGLVGAGRSEILRCLFGLDHAATGRIRLGDGPWRPLPRSPRAAMALGLDMLSENRKEEGLATALSLKTNITLNTLGRFARPGGIVDGRRERDAVAQQLQRLAVRHRAASQPAADLSGGNQQKVAIGRNLLRDAPILLLDEPTRGIDVGSKVDIYRLIGELAAQGKAMIVVSSYLPELFGICDTLAVVHRGQLSPKRPLAEWTDHSVMTYATSGQADPIVSTE